MFRRLAALAAASLLSTLGLTAIGATPVFAATCAYTGGGLIGADLTGWLPDYGAGPVNTLQPLVYDVVGYAPLSGGCTTGELDLIAYSTNGTVGSCTLILPKPLSTGPGCDNVLGDGGVAVTRDHVYGYQLTVRGELVAVGADGSRVTRLSNPCTGSLDPFGDQSFRCPL